jgi:uncharacterized membrane protein
MYLFDPTSGRRRRARLRDQLGSAALKARRGLDAAGRDLSNRAHGIAAKTRLAFDHSPVGDEVLTERIRSTLGRVVSHPGAIHVSVTRGRLELSGAILAREYASLMRALADVRGAQQIDEIEDRLEVHQYAGRISSLQGGRMRETRFELLQDHWTPAIRLLIGTAGLGLVAFGLRHRSIGAALGGIAGAGLLLRSSTNAPLANLTSRHAIEIRKTLRVNAPLEQVFETLANYENFPHFMRNVRSVRTHADGRSHWCVTGPAGTTIEWDSHTTRFVPNELIAWRTTPHASVKHSGHIRFRPERDGTCLEIHMRYWPPAGALGHGVAMLFGVDPRKEMDEDLLRLKTFLETGKRPHDSAARLHGTRAESEASLRAASEPIHAQAVH